MKTHHRLGYVRLAEALAESGLVDQKSLRDALQYSGTGGTMFPAALVESNLVTDWELSRVVCDLYGLPFLPVEQMPPDPAAFEGLDLNFLRQHSLIPIGRFGLVLTVCMPGLVEADVLGMLSAQSDLFVLPVVGTVRSNQHWLDNNVKEAPAAQTATEEATDIVSGWGSFFDEADAAVLMDIQTTVEKMGPIDGIEVMEDMEGMEPVDLDQAVPAARTEPEVPELPDISSLRVPPSAPDESDAEPDPPASP